MRLSSRDFLLGLGLAQSVVGSDGSLTRPHQADGQQPLGVFGWSDVVWEETHGASSCSGCQVSVLKGALPVDTNKTRAF